MKYMLLIYDNETDFEKIPEKAVQEMMGGLGKFTTELKEAGAHISSHRLRPSGTATAVRVRSGKTMLTDGPFAETKEQLGGYYLVNVKALDKALKWAGEISSTRTGSIEVRPVWD